MTGAASTRHCALPGLQADSYRPHRLHGAAQVWVEKNCYVDVWIEVLHALGLEPEATMGFTLSLDFEGDQWTFFKPPHSDLRALFGIEVQELTVWRPLIEHAAEHLGAGKLIATEADAFWLPDTAGTDYQRQHNKTTIVLNDLDLAAERLGYFHNASYHRLGGEDFRRLFRIDQAHDPTFLPLYAELIRLDRVVQLPPATLAELALRLLREHLGYRPQTNPLRRFGTRLDADFAQIQAGGLAHYHAWAFATVRQCGAAFDLAAAHLRWLAGHGDAAASGLLPAAESFDRIAQGCKTLILKAARAVNAQRALDAAPAIDAMAQAWDAAMAQIEQSLAR